MRYLSESLSGLFSVNYFKILLFLLALIPSLSLNGQYFGKNKVKYKNMNWKMVETPHFNIYYYNGGEYLAEFAANVAEDSYREISYDLSWDLKKKIPILVYDSHNDFQQTNVTPGIIEEQVGGFTEIYKSRIVVPFDGSYEEFRHVINHELTHAFQYDILYGKNTASTIISQVTTDIPLWFIEGMAEYESRWLDPETDIFMRDLILNGEYIKIQDLWMYGGYLIYKEGQMIEYYLTQTFGKKILGDILFKCKTEKSFEKAVKSSTGLTLEELDGEIRTFLRKRYFSYYDNKSEYTQFSSRITKCDSTYFLNAGGSISPNGNYTAFFSDRTGRYSVYLKNIFTNKTKLIIGGEKTRDYEQMHILRPYIGWFPDSKSFAFVTKSGSRDCIHIYNLRKKKVVKRISFDLNAIYSPSVSPDGKTMVFTGIRNGMEDIYMVRLKDDKNYRRLTFDKYDDREPVFYDDSTIIFVSDRPKDNEWVYGEYSIWAYNINNDSLYEVMNKKFHNISKPAVYKNNIYFTSNDEGFGNIFRLNYDRGIVEKITDVLCGISNVSVSKNGKWAVFDGVKGMRKDLYLIKDISLLKPKKFTPVAYNMRYTKNIGIVYKKTKARTVFNADIMMGYLGYSSYGGAFGQGLFLFSDLYGDNELLVQMDLGSYNILNGNYYAQYMNLKHRFNLGIALNKYTSTNYYSNPIAVMLNNNYGIALYADLPFDKFNRIEETINYNYYVDSLFIYDQTEEQFYLNGIYSYHSLFPSIAFVHDDALDSYMGYVSGNLFRLELQRSLVFNRRDMMDFYYLFLDYRHYSTFFKRYTLATRLIGDAGGGIDASRFTISGVDGLRGYDYGDINGKYVWLFQNELRFRLLKDITFDNPIPIRFGSIYSAIFLDVGSGFDNYNDYVPVARNVNGWQLEDIKADAGISFRVNLGITLLQFDITKRLNLMHFEGDTKYTLWLGGLY